MNSLTDYDLPNVGDTFVFTVEQTLQEYGAEHCWLIPVGSVGVVFKVTADDSSMNHPEVLISVGGKLVVAYWQPNPRLTVTITSPNSWAKFVFSQEEADSNGAIDQPVLVRKNGHKFTFPAIRKVFPSMISQEIVSVQPMSLPAGALFYLDYQYGADNKISSINSNNPTSGSCSTTQAPRETTGIKEQAKDGFFKSIVENYKKGRKNRESSPKAEGEKLGWFERDAKGS